VRGGDLFGNKSFIAAITKQVKSRVRGVESLLLQHRPLLQEILELAKTHKLKPATFPFIDQPAKAPKAWKTIYVYIVGGVTYEEATTIALLNKSAEWGIKVFLGGSCVHNSKSFLADLSQAHERRGEGEGEGGPGPGEVPRARPAGAEDEADGSGRLERKRREDDDE